MIEDRKHFIMRMQMMIQEIRMSNLDDANIHSMIEFQLLMLKLKEGTLIL